MSLIKQPLKTKNLSLKNRLVMPPMYTKSCSLEGFVTDVVVNYYADRAKGDCIGLVITEHAYVTPDSQGRANPNMMWLGSDECLEGQKRLVDAIHEGGSLACAQINHGGSLTKSSTTGMEIVSASAVANPTAKMRYNYEEIPRALTKEEILELEDMYVAAAVRAKKAGYDAVEIHSAHSYLMCQFYSPLTNKRTDEYGPQTIENRTRFQIETFRKIKAALGEDFPVLIRLGGCDYTEGGSTIEDAVEACKLFDKEGFDIIDLSGGACFFFPPNDDPEVYFTEMTKAVTAAVSTPVIVTGGVSDIAKAESLLETKCGDLVGVGRALLKDADWARREMAKID